MKYLVIFSVVILFIFSACKSTNPPVEPFFVSINSPKIPMGTVEAQLDRFFNMGGIDKNEFTIEYFPHEDAVCLQYRNDFITYHQFWNREGRQVFLDAVKQYGEDFEQRNLSTKNNRNSMRRYGTVEGFLVWQTTQVSVRAMGNPKIEIGYRFRNIPDSKGRAAFLILNQRQVLHEDPITRGNNRLSPDVIIYFTRAQAETLAEFFDPHFIQTLSGIDPQTEPRSRAPELDVY